MGARGEGGTPSSVQFLKTIILPNCLSFPASIARYVRCEGRESRNLRNTWIPFPSRRSCDASAFAKATADNVQLLTRRSFSVGGRPGMTSSIQRSCRLLYSFSTTRPVILPWRRSSSVREAIVSGRVATGMGSIWRARTSAIISSASASVPT